MCHCVMSLNIIGPNMNHVNIIQPSLLVAKAERFSSDNKSDFIIIKIISKNHIRFGGVGWLVEGNLNLQIKAALCNVPPDERNMNS